MLGTTSKKTSSSSISNKTSYPFQLTAKSSTIKTSAALTSTTKPPPPPPSSSSISSVSSNVNLPSSSDTSVSSSSMNLSAKSSSSSANLETTISKPQIPSSSLKVEKKKDAWLDYIHTDDNEYDGDDIDMLVKRKQKSKIIHDDDDDEEEEEEEELDYKKKKNKKTQDQKKNKTKKTKKSVKHYDESSSEDEHFENFLKKVEVEEEENQDDLVDYDEDYETYKQNKSASSSNIVKTKSNVKASGDSIFHLVYATSLSESPGLVGVVIGTKPCPKSSPPKLILDVFILGSYKSATKYVKIFIGKTIPLLQSECELVDVANRYTTVLVRPFFEAHNRAFGNTLKINTFEKDLVSCGFTLDHLRPLLEKQFPSFKKNYKDVSSLTMKWYVLDFLRKSATIQVKKIVDIVHQHGAQSLDVWCTESNIISGDYVAPIKRRKKDVDNTSNDMTSANQTVDSISSSSKSDDNNNLDSTFTDSVNINMSFSAINSTNKDEVIVPRDPIFSIGVDEINDLTELRKHLNLVMKMCEDARSEQIKQKQKIVQMDNLRIEAENVLEESQLEYQAAANEVKISKKSVDDAHQGELDLIKTIDLEKENLDRMQKDLEDHQSRYKKWFKKGMEAKMNQGIFNVSSSSSSSSVSKVEEEKEEKKGEDDNANVDMQSASTSTSASAATMMIGNFDLSNKEHMKVLLNDPEFHKILDSLGDDVYDDCAVEDDYDMAYAVRQASKIKEHQKKLKASSSSSFKKLPPSKPVVVYEMMENYTPMPFWQQYPNLVLALENAYQDWIQQGRPKKIAHVWYNSASGSLHTAMASSTLCNYSIMFSVSTLNPKEDAITQTNMKTGFTRSIIRTIKTSASSSSALSSSSEEAVSFECLQVPMPSHWINCAKQESLKIVPHTHFSMVKILTCPSGHEAYKHLSILVSTKSRTVKILTLSQIQDISSLLLYRGSLKALNLKHSKYKMDPKHKIDPLIPTQETYMFAIESSGSVANDAIFQSGGYSHGGRSINSITSHKGYYFTRSLDLVLEWQRQNIGRSSGSFDVAVARVALGCCIKSSDLQESQMPSLIPSTNEYHDSLITKPIYQNFLNKIGANEHPLTVVWENHQFVFEYKMTISVN